MARLLLAYIARALRLLILILLTFLFGLTCVAEERNDGLLVITCPVLLDYRLELRAGQPLIIRRHPAFMRSLNR